MDIRSLVPGLAELQARTPGDPSLRVAVLDGPVDRTHPCFAGAGLTLLQTVPGTPPGAGAMSLHGTHVASILFGQPAGPVPGIAPACHGLLAPVFRDGARLSQLELARAIEQALDAGARLISVSGGERAPGGRADDLLERALRRCADAGVLVVAAVGNDGCDCLQVPAAVDSVLAVGAAAVDGAALRSSNWGKEYRANGILAPGQRIDGAEPGGGVRELSGTSFATPVVAGIAALLMSLQLRDTGRVNAAAVRRALLDTATPCAAPGTEECQRSLVGTVNVQGAFDAITTGGKEAVSTSEPIIAPPPSEPDPAVAEVPAAGAMPAAEPAPVPAPAVLAAAAPAASPEPGTTAPPAGAPAAAVAGVPVANVAPHPGHEHGGVRAAGDCGCGCGGSAALVYAIGTIGVDFGTEARRDGFRQNMDRVTVGAGTGADAAPVSVPANPYDPFQLGSYLAGNPWASDKLIWTLNLDRTPIYALQAEAPVGMTWAEPVIEAAGQQAGTAPVPGSPGLPPVSYVYKTLRDAFAGQALPDTDPNFVSRVSVPGVLTDRTVRLFSGQVVPVVLVRSRGLYAWNEQILVDATAKQVLAQAKSESALDEASLKDTVRAFLDKIYYQFRNLGRTSADRALNFAATNAFMFTDEIREGILSGQYVPGPNNGMFTLDTISVQKSPYCRMDSDCWDVRVTFVDPENDRRARVAYLFTIDVSDELPVSLAPSHRFLLTNE
jgi:cyanobactin maturation PatA/PatG family protease